MYIFILNCEKLTKEEQKMKKTNEQNGITLIVLVISIIILLILATITIQSLTNTGLFKNAQLAKEKSEEAELEQQTRLNEYENALNGYYTSTKTLQADGSWNSTKKVNSPQLMTGMTGIYWDGDGNEVEVNVDNQDNWYDYSAQKWANAKTEDGSYWVWIPRYAYKIESGRYTSTAGRISVKFLQGTSNKDENNYPETTGATMSAYVVHPSFTDGSEKGKNNHFMNGEWDKEIVGYWVAKYPAGFQANTITNNNGILSTTISNSSDTIVYSEKNYHDYNSSYTTNAISQTLSSKPKMSYPVFKPSTYAYNNISTGDAYTLSQEIKNGSGFYGLKSTETDSHQMKNSEWGAVAYLTQSNKGRNGIEINLNNYYTAESSPWRTAITGMCINGTSGDKTTTLGNAYNTTIGVKGSSTANITGIYDLNGCIWERTAAYISNGNDNLGMCGSSYANTTANVNGYQTFSTKYVTVYPYDSSNDNYAQNYSIYSDKKSTAYGFGDAILETSIKISGLVGWNSDAIGFPNTNGTFTARGGCYVDSSNSGIFTFSGDYGNSFGNNGFRSVLVAQ